jgi:type I restriction enzyme S subunit
MITNQMTGTAIKRIILDKIRTSFIPLTGLSEQQKISEQIELHLSRFEYALRTVKNNIIYSKKLRNSILKNAFEGKLVPQDPTDEPTSILLEKIKYSKGSTNKKKLDNKQTRLV